jgi:enediyne biosynthesis protein E9
VSPVERVDVCIVGSGFGGAIAAWRLSELYRAAGQDASVMVLERGMRKQHLDFRQSMDIEHLSDVYGLIQGQGAQIVIGNVVGGGSNLYLAASLRAPSETFERRDRRSEDGPDRRMWPSQISRSSLNPFYARAEKGLRVQRPTWNEVSKSGGLWAATLKAAGHTCDRVPLAISRKRCVNAKWCYTGCPFAAKNSLITNYLAAAEVAGVEVRPLTQVNAIRQSQSRPYRYIVDAVKIDPQTKADAGAANSIECKVLILAAGALGTPPILMRSKTVNLPGISNQVGRHLNVNGDHVAAIEYDPNRVKAVLGLADGAQFHKGKPITTMTYDYFAGRSGRQHDGTRFTLQEILLSALTNVLYDDGRAPAGDPSWWGRQKKQSVGTWSNHIEVLAMVEETSDGNFVAPPPQGGSHIRVNPGPIGIGPFIFQFSEQSLRVREAANQAIKSIIDRNKLGRFLKLTETQGAYAAHPLGGCRMADSAALGVVDPNCEAFGNEGLFCMDSSVMPTSLGVNPSLTIAAVCERAAEKLVARADDYGLPAPAPDLRHRPPREIVGPRVHP